MSERPDLNELRGKLDDIDNSILDLFEERIATCREIGNIKRETGTDVYVPAREEEKLQKELNEIDEEAFNKRIAEMRAAGKIDAKGNIVESKSE